MRPLTKKVVLITGASRGIGVDIAHAFGKQGSRLALAARSADDLEKVRIDLEAAGVEAIAVPTDVSDLASLEALVATVTGKLGSIDVLVNNAGVEEVCEFETMPPDDIEWIIKVNVTGLIWLTRLVVPSMIERRWGHIVNMASMAGLVAVPHNSVYSSSKHAVVGVSRSLRVELAEHNIGVSVVCPGFVEGGMFAQWGRKAPAMAGSVTTQKVADAVVAAVLRDKAEINVNKGLGKIADWFQASMPETYYGILRRTGVSGFLRDQARINAERGHGSSS